MSQLQEIKKEFELERMILFSDAVFAIAITLLILEVKFPELHKNMSNEELKMVFRPVLIQFLAFVISFFFIGAMWARHLEMFKYLCRYNSVIIALNLLFLFFIVCFPFSASAFSENTKSGMALPILLYLGNIACVAIVKGILGIYLFRKENLNTVRGEDAMKKYLYLQGMWTAIAITIIFIILLIQSLFFTGNQLQLVWPLYLFGVIMFFINRKLKKLKPKKEEQSQLQTSTASANLNPVEIVETGILD